jgi:hypothetical protein
MKLSELIKDDSPTKLHKNVAIAKSGIYQYHRMELDGLFDGHATIPSKHATRSVFNVFRPPEVLRDAKSLFVHLPLMREHPEDFVSPDNIRDRDFDWIGWTGDSSKIVDLEDEGEVTINSTLNIVDKLGINDYGDGIREVSPGYSADFIWKDGIDKNGTPYQIVMTKIKEVNHLALVDQGRGGKDASILDSKYKETTMDENVVMSALKKLFGKKEKVLDSMPKNIEKFTDEQKDYLLKETHRLLMHRVSGKTFDSFMPIGYTKDDMGPEDAFPIEEKKAEDAFPIEEKKAEDAFPIEEKKAEDAFPIEEKKDEEEKDGEEDAPAVEAGGPAVLEVSPTTTTGTGEVKTVTPQAPARANDHMTVKITDSVHISNGPDPFAIMDQVRNGFASTAKKENK